jgi:hypothetical protein
MAVDLRGVVVGGGRPCGGGRVWAVRPSGNTVVDRGGRQPIYGWGRW